jgi:hypothetical protein
MLSHVIAARSVVAAALTAAVLATAPAAPALALGDREKGFVVGVATALIVDRLIQQNRSARGVQGLPGFNLVEPRTATVVPRAVATPSIYGTSAARAFNSYSVEERKAIQRQLRAWGYYRGGIDGAFGPGTHAAVTAYARDEGLSGSLATRNGAYAVYDGLLF